MYCLDLLVRLIRWGAICHRTNSGKHRSLHLIPTKGLHSSYLLLARGQTLLYEALGVNWPGALLRPNMMTSLNGNIFRVTGLLWVETTRQRWIPLSKQVSQSFGFLPLQKCQVINVCLNCNAHNFVFKGFSINALMKCWKHLPAHVADVLILVNTSRWKSHPRFADKICKSLFSKNRCHSDLTLSLYWFNFQYFVRKRPTDYMLALVR